MFGISRLHMSTTKPVFLNDFLTENATREAFDASSGKTSTEDTVNPTNYEILEVLKVILGQTIDVPVKGVLERVLCEFTRIEVFQCETSVILLPASVGGVTSKGSSMFV